MTRRTSLMALGLAIIVLLLGLQSWSIAVGRVERHVIAGIEDRIGVRITGLGRAEIAFLPLPRISLSQISFARPDGMMGGTAARLRARARLLPLLIGRLSFDRIDLIGANIDVAVTHQDEAPGAWLTTPLAYLAGVRSQSRIVVNSSVVFLRAGDANPQSPIVSVLRDVNVIVDERQANEPVSLSGSVNWRGVPSEVSLVWPMATGDSTRLSASVISDLLTLRLEGSRTGSSEPVINGRLSLAARSLPALFAWFGEKPRLSNAIGQLSLAADAQIKPGEASLSNVSATIDGDRLIGVLKLAENGQRFAVSGTLAGASLDLGRLSRQLDWQGPDKTDDATAPLDFAGWTAHDLDLRVSVDAARIEGARLSDVASYLLVKQGRFEAGLLRATAYGGSVKGRLLATSAPSATGAGVEVRLQAGLDRINLGQSAADLPDLARWTGTATLQAALEGMGSSASELLKSFSGKTTLTVRQGDIAGFAFIDMLRRVERNPGVALRDWRQGKTPFETALLNATVANGVATITEAQLTHSAYRLTLSGHASLPERRADLAGQLMPVAGPVRVPLVLRGPLDNIALSLGTDAAPIPATINPTMLTR